MYRFLLTPRWWGINLFVALGVPFCLFMGSWQLGRFETRVESHREQQRDADAHAEEAAAPLADLLPVTKETSGRRATATGRYDTQLLVPDRRLGDRNGFYVLTLLRTEGGDALPVVRGWLPGDADRADVPEPPRGKVTVTGALQSSETQSSDGARSGGLPRGQLGMISAASLVNVVPYGVYDAWITLPETGAETGAGAGAGAGAQGALRPVPPTAPQGSGLDLKAFQNLGYTGEWFVFAGFVVFMWFRLLRREAEAQRDLALGLLPEQTEQAVADRTGRADRAERAEGPEAGGRSEQPGPAERTSPAEQTEHAPGRAPVSGPSDTGSGRAVPESDPAGRS
ncbi:SURF1 family protein [Streptomyces sp. bgisy100]|uniref:SURF1 family protein n=1 Tax=Streptomyces sp. bgisy100 TaxID=3413783 RepID=UPI003D713B7E